MSRNTSISLGNHFEDFVDNKVAQQILFHRKLGVGKIEIRRILHAQMDLKNRVQT